MQYQACVGVENVEEEDGRRGRKEIPYPKVTPSWATARPSPGSNPVTSSHVEPRSRACAHSQEPGTATGAGWDPVLGDGMEENPNLVFF